MIKADKEIFVDLFIAINEGVGISYNERFREFGLNIYDGGSSSILIKYCPFTAEKLPESLRNEWFDLAEENNWLSADGSMENVPDIYRTDLWWRLGVREIIHDCLR